MALLPVVLLIVVLVFRRDAGRAAGLPWFVVAFLGLMILRNTVALPETAMSLGNDASRFLLELAISALGGRTSLQKLFAPGLKGLVLIGLATLWPLGQAIVFSHAFLR